MPSKTPRFSRSEKPLYRLWEALCLTCMIRPTHGPHTVTRHDPTSLIATQRRFRRNLAFICDHSKGGDSTTSLVIEDRDDDDECFRFWLSANQGVSEATIEFVTKVLDILSASIEADNALAARFEAMLLRECVAFSRNRIENAKSRLRNFSRDCRRYLETEDFSSYEMSRSPKDVASWLQKFDFDRGTSSYDVCIQAYDARHDEEIAVIVQLGRDPDDGTNPGPMVRKFRGVKHFIGRLAAYVRASKELLEDAQRLRESRVLDLYEVAAVDRAVPADVPPADSQTTLEGILRRMLRKDDPRFPALLDTLMTLDASGHIEEKIRAQFSGGIKPCVHAEIQMLEHCVRTGLKFAWNDRYIACSKPACLACTAYFAHHPVRFVRPDSHQKAYVNWAPALRPDGQVVFMPDLEFFTKVIRDIREVALQQIGEARVSREWHPDTMTNITGQEEEERYDTSSFEDMGSEESEDEDEDAGVLLAFDD